MPMVFFNISRCIVIRASPLRNCRISRLISSGVWGIGASTGLAPSPYWRFQSRKFQTLTPNSCATSSALLPLVSQWSTTERLNSDRYRFRLDDPLELVSWVITWFSQTQVFVSSFSGEGLFRSSFLVLHSSFKEGRQI